MRNGDDHGVAHTFSDGRLNLKTKRDHEDDDERREAGEKKRKTRQEEKERYLSVGLQVDRGGSFVHDDDLRSAQHSSGEGEHLPLADAEAFPAFADLHVEGLEKDCTRSRLMMIGPQFVGRGAARQAPRVVPKHHR